MQTHLHRDAEPSRPSVRIARNLRHTREQRGHSRDELAAVAGIDAATLDRLETGKGEPPPQLAWRLAQALEVPFSALFAEIAAWGTMLLRAGKTPHVAWERPGLSSRALPPHEEERAVEFYQLKLAPHYRENCAAHAPNTTEALHVTSESVEVSVGRKAPHRLQKGDTIQFAADLPHACANVGDEPALLYLVMTCRPASGSAA